MGIAPEAGEMPEEVTSGEVGDMACGPASGDLLVVEIFRADEWLDTDADAEDETDALADADRSCAAAPSSARRHRRRRCSTRKWSTGSTSLLSAFSSAGFGCRFTIRDSTSC